VAFYIVLGFAIVSILFNAVLAKKLRVAQNKLTNMQIQNPLDNNTNQDASDKELNIAEIDRDSNSSSSGSDEDSHQGMTDR